MVKFHGGDTGQEETQLGASPPKFPDGENSSPILLLNYTATYFPSIILFLTHQTLQKHFLVSLLKYPHAYQTNEKYELGRPS